MIKILVNKYCLMTKKIILTVIIAVAFSVGMIASPNIATAHLDMCAQPAADSMKSVWHALCDLQNQIDAIPDGPPGPPGADAGPIGIFVAQVASDGSVYGRGTPNIMVDARGNGNYVVTFTDFPTSGLSSGLCNAVASATLGSGQPGDEGSLIDTDFSVIAAAFHLGGGNVNVITMDIPGGPTVNKNFNVILACSSP